MSNTKNIETNVVKPSTTLTENSELRILEETQEKTLDGKVQDIVDYMENNNGRGETSKVKDSIYAESQKLWNTLRDALTEAKYNFWLNRSQYNFLTDTILKKMEYDVNTVFFAIELTDTFGRLKDMNFANDQDLNKIEVTATEITYIYHLISKHTVKGITNNSYRFAEVLQKIGDISKLFNYYDATSKNLAEDIQKWVFTFDENVTTDEKETVKLSKTEKETAQ